MPNPIMFFNWLIFILLVLLARSRSEPIRRNTNTLFVIGGYLVLHALFYAFSFTPDSISAGMCKALSDCWKDYIWVYWIGPIMSH